MPSTFQCCTIVQMEREFSLLQYIGSASTAERKYEKASHGCRSLACSLFAGRCCPKLSISLSWNFSFFPFFPKVWHLPFSVTQASTIQLHSNTGESRVFAIAVGKVSSYCCKERNTKRFWLELTSFIELCENCNKVYKDI